MESEQSSPGRWSAGSLVCQAFLVLPLIKFCLAIITEGWMDGSEDLEQKASARLQKAQSMKGSWDRARVESWISPSKLFSVNIKSNLLTTAYVSLEFFFNITFTLG